MPIKRWHGGKIALIWVVAIVLGGVLFLPGVVLADEVNETLGGVVAFGGPLGLFVLCVGLTWSWLSGREEASRKRG